MSPAKTWGFITKREDNGYAEATRCLCQHTQQRVVCYITGTQRKQSCAEKTGNVSLGLLRFVSLIVKRFSHLWIHYDPTNWY